MIYLVSILVAAAVALLVYGAASLSPVERTAYSVRQRLVEQGFDPTDDEVREVTRRVKDHGASDQRVTVDTLIEFAHDVGVDEEGGDSEDESEREGESDEAEVQA